MAPAPADATDATRYGVTHSYKLAMPRLNAAIAAWARSPTPNFSRSKTSAKEQVPDLAWLR